MYIHPQQLKCLLALSLGTATVRQLWEISQYSRAYRLSALGVRRVSTDDKVVVDAESIRSDLGRIITILMRHQVRMREILVAICKNLILVLLIKLADLSL